MQDAATTAAPALHTVRSAADTDSLHTTLGVLGGGQLGRMLVHAAQRMGYATVVLDPAPDSPAGQASHNQIVAAYDEQAGWDQLAEACDGLTTEFENVPAAALEYLAARKPVSPPAQAVAKAQDRIEEKRHFTACGVRCAPWLAVQTEADLEAAAALLPGILKTARMGYDGKGQAVCHTADELRQAWSNMGRVACVLEQKLALALECSVIVARGADGHIVNFQPQRNVHHGGILATTYAFAGAVPVALSDALVEATRRIAEGLEYVGVLCVEYFVLQDGSWVVNEMAPRPHNSGHYTIDACEHSQFDLQVRTTMNLPLVQPRHHSPSIMLNLLGDAWYRHGERIIPPWEAIQQLPGVQLHLYGKQDVKPGRKMGHVTLTAATVDELQDKAVRVAGLLHLPFERLDVA